MKDWRDCLGVLLNWVAFAEMLPLIFSGFFLRNSNISSTFWADTALLHVINMKIPKTIRMI
ncbi:hypothetical protein ABVC71_02915 [Prevotella amnii]|uniref:hypothetical protein n=1 Tax=Prevotella amnii TaxID=419005 RepID=UPI00336AE7F3